MATLSTAEILTDVIDAFKKRFPLLTAVSTDFSPDTIRVGQTVTSRILSLPTVRDYDGTDGYKASAANANGLSTDVSVAVDRHKHVPIKVDYLDQVSTKRDLYNEAVGNLAYTLGKEAVDYMLSLVVAANFSESTTEAAANTDNDTLNTIRAAMNAAGANPDNRYGVLNSAAFSALSVDPDISSGDYFGQRVTSNAFGTLQNVQGFREIWEYPDLPANSENLSGFFFDPRAVVMASRLPSDAFDLADRLGVNIANREVITDPDTGLSMMAITWQDAGTFDVYHTLTWAYGAVAGKQGGSAGALTDYAGHRVVTA